jgi:hypothetical protein
MYAEDPWGLGPDDKTDAGMRRRMLQMLQEGGCRQPNEVLAAARRLFQDGELPGPLGVLVCSGPASVGETSHVAGTPLPATVADGSACHGLYVPSQEWIPREASSPQMC